MHQKIWHSGICSFQWPQLSKNYPPWWGAELASSAGKTLHSFKLRIKAIPWGRWSRLDPSKVYKNYYANTYILVTFTIVIVYCYCAQSLVVFKVYSFCFPAWFYIFALPSIERMLPDMLPVSELISMWHRIKEATNLQGRIGSRREDSSFRVSEASKNYKKLRLI